MPFAQLRQAARRIKRDVIVVYFAARDQRTPRLLRLFALGIAAYALSPIDLIPDAIPVLGLVDDIILVPLAIALLMRWLPAAVVVDARARADALTAWPRSLVAATVIVLIWIATAIGLGAYCWTVFY
jgi:uncharacterized membrane protein YkvA (DUF1232 family)